MPKPGPSEFVRLMHERLATLGDVDCSRFFGGWAFRASGRQFALVMKDTLYFRVDDSLRRDLIAAGCAPFSYAKRGGRVVVERFYAAPEACIDDDVALERWLARAVEAARVLDQPHHERGSIDG